MSNHKYIVLKEEQLVLILFQNNVTFGSLKELTKNVVNSTEFRTNYKILIDLRLSNIDMTFNEVERFSNCLHNNLKLDLCFLISVLTKTPEQVAKSMIFTLSKKSNCLKYEVLSTLEASLNHLNFKASNFEMIEEKLRVANNKVQK